MWDERRSAGALLPITALPGPCGIGVLGREARDFVDFLRQGAFRLWQILPIEHTGDSFSPYKCLSAFAGEPMLIDPRQLLEKGWITGDELAERCQGLETYRVVYETAQKKQLALLRLAFGRLSGADREACRRFNPFWLEAYALFMAIKGRQGDLPWFAWTDAALRGYDGAAVARAKDELAPALDFYRFVQWEFDNQWQALRRYANRQGVSLIGDMPFYVSEDSAEVWSCREMFAIDEAGRFLAVAGAPPDYFNQAGQRWGNPLYNWQYLEQQGYSWWTERMREALTRYDLVRIDHFRGFESYWRIPAASPTARDGQWVKGPGIGPFQAMEKALGKLPVVAENLGDVGEAVEKLLAETGFLGMGVLQFGFLGDARHLPHRFHPRTAAYTGTHDNTTLLAWMYELREKERNEALFYAGYEGDWGRGGPNCGICQAWLRILYMSAASLVIAPIQDLLGYGGDTRINIPGTAQGNWRFRVTAEALAGIDTGFYRRLAEVFDRAT
ncbi:MAG: 4-alpha-glucanotransferase [Peptococcaceae bacterium]|jgi:4-alpha-glucanotransferase|nr:4-alpha-glucanotransferase [Peptococcaceae bacterium]